MPGKAKSGNGSASDEADQTGTYVYDAELGRVVKVSGRVPGLSKGSNGFSGEAPGGGGCGREECGGGTCMGGGLD